MSFSTDKCLPEKVRNITNFSSDQITFIKKLHLEENIPAQKIHELHPSLGSTSSIIRLLKKEGVYKYHWYEPKIALQNRVEECIALYESLGSFRKVAGAMGRGVTKDQVDFCLQKYAPLIIKRKPTLEEVNYFENIDTHLKAYFLGFIAADGCILENKSGNKSLEIGINKKDVVVLEKLLDELKSSHNIRYKEATSSCSIHISNSKLISDIERIGITSRKSLTMPNLIHNIPTEFQSSFICGLYDGDGSIGFYKRAKCNTWFISVGLIGTKEVVEGVRNWLEKNIELKTKYIYNNKNRNPLTVQFNFTRRSEVIEFFKRIYFPCPFSLKRKYDKFLNFPEITNFLQGNANE